MKNLVLLFCLIFTACSSGGPILSVCAFYEVPIGATCEELIAYAGNPVASRQLPDGTVEYEYLERFKVGSRILNERHYFILIRDGIVVEKRMGQISPNPFGYDSYDMQTTQKDSWAEFLISNCDLEIFTNQETLI